jgi:DNA polymerase III subunit alpha
MKWASLHHHTTFSYLDGYGTPATHFERAAELGVPALAMTEHGNISSHVRAEQASKATGVKAVFGCELYAGAVDEENRTQRKNHLTVLAEDEAGYRNLMRVVSRGWAEGFYYEPTVSGAILREHAEGLVVLSGCTASLLATSLIGGKNVDPEDASYARAKRTAKRFKSVFGDAYYLEVQCLPELDDVRRINQAYERLSDELGIPLVATADVHYCKPDEADMRKILHGQRSGGRKSFDEIGQEWDYTIDASPPVSDKEVYRRLRACGMSKVAAESAVLNAGLVAERCNVTLPRIRPLEYPLPNGAADARQVYRTWLNQGWRKRGFHKLPKRERQRYVERVEYENELIESKGFVDYFLVLSDVVRYSKRSGIAVGPARGSAAASLVCYLLEITEVNPMKYPTLLFERFIDVNRHDLPDVDLDFDDDRRHEIREYLSGKYGEDRVGNIGTFTQYKGKNSLDDVARVFRIPKWDVDTVKELLPERSSGDLRYGDTILDALEMFPQVQEIFKKHPALHHAVALEGNMRGMSVHAAGLVVANEPLTNACAVYARETNGQQIDVLSVDKHDANYLNVLKIDVLGLKTMGLIGQALAEIGMTLDEMYALEPDDPDVLKGFQENDVVGIFQFDGRAMRSVNAGVVPDSFSEVCDVNALARPGPLHSGATAEYIDVKHGRSEPKHYHPIIDKVTKHTQYQIVYQEQILQIVRELGQFSWKEASEIRKIISKKKGEAAFNAQRGKFLEGATNNGLEESEANEVWNLLTTSGAYAFNAAHCVSYGMLAYWCMYLKRKHPAAFFSAALRKYEGDKEKHAQLMRDAAKRDLPVLPPDLNRSGVTWTREKTKEGEGLRAGFGQVHGIGEKTARAIVDFREQECDGELTDWHELLMVKGIGQGTITKIVNFVQDPDPFGLELLKNTIANVRDEIASGKGALGKLPTPTHTSIEVPYERGEDTEVVWLGVIRDRNFKDLFENHRSRTGEHLDPDEVRDPELINWMVMQGEDQTDLLTITIDRWKWPRFADTCWSIKTGEDLVLVHGVKRGFQARRAVYVTDLWVIDPTDD